MLFRSEATANLKTELQGYTINIAGEGEESYINELKQLASKLGVENLIHFIHLCGRAEPKCGEIVYQKLLRRVP